MKPNEPLPFSADGMKRKLVEIINATGAALKLLPDVPEPPIRCRKWQCVKCHHLKRCSFLIRLLFRNDNEILNRLHVDLMLWRSNKLHCISAVFLCKVKAPYFDCPIFRIHSFAKCRLLSCLQ